MLGRTDSRRRLIVLMLTMVVIASALGGRLAYWQLAQGNELRGMANAQLARPVQAEQRRGDITDRSGTLLATTAYRDRLVAYPDLVPADRREAVAGQLAALVGLSGADRDALYQAFRDARSYVTVARRLTDGQSAEVRRELASGDLVGVGLEPVAARFYPNPGGAPNTTLASQLLGFVTDDGLGRYGIEQRDQALLAGTSTDTASLDAAAGQPAPAVGANVQLTIDASLQLRVEKELYATWVADQAKRVSAVVMDPNTGAVLAWASVPGYDANDYAAVARSDPGLFVDPIASQIYEPGSVMKMLTAAAALEKGVVDLDTTVFDDKELVFGHSRVRNADHKGMGPMQFQDAIAFSRNVATAKVAMELGDNTTDSASVLYSMWQRLGFGRPTGIDLANEAAGITSNPETQRWADIDLADRAFGQAVAVTPLQLAVAYSAMANGGRLVEPYLVASVDGKPNAPAQPQQVIDPSLSQRLRELMMHVLTTQPVLHAHTSIPGYVVGGKTGTAQFWDTHANAWATDAFNYTFCGFVGADAPGLIVVVRIHEAEPTVRRKSGSVLPEVQSFDLFRRIAQEAIAVLDMPPLPGFDPTAVPSDAPPSEAVPTPTPADALPTDSAPTTTSPSGSPAASGDYWGWAESPPPARP
jgi:cell division protein FtsI/penicillin-binding protein 2